MKAPASVKKITPSLTRRKGRLYIVTALRSDSERVRAERIEAWRRSVNRHDPQP